MFDDVGAGPSDAAAQFVVSVASLLAVAFGWVISASLVVNEVTAEELSRTTPRLRDLMIALAAGAAGMYSVVRKDLSGVVPGVAIAVALVPPLATIGIVLELHEWSLAQGAALLYAMNVMAIVIAAIVVLLLTDFMRSPPLRNIKVLIWGTALVVLSVAVFVPVWQNSRRLDREGTFSDSAETATADWSLAHPTHRVLIQRVKPGQVTLVIAGPTAPPDLDLLWAAFATDAFPDPTVEVDWAQSSITQVSPGN